MGRELYHLYVRVLHKTRTSRINGSRLIFDTASFIVIIDSYHLSTFHPQSCELKQKVTYTGACHTIIELLGNRPFSIYLNSA